MVDRKSGQLGIKILRTHFDVAYLPTKEYYRLLRGKNIGNKTYIKWLDNAQFRRLYRNVELIDSVLSIDVFVAENKEEQNAVQAIRKAATQHSWDKFDTLTTKHSDLMVSVPLYSSDDKDTALHAFNKVAPDIDARSDKEGEYIFTSGLELPESTVSSRLF